MLFFKNNHIITGGNSKPLYQSVPVTVCPKVFSSSRLTLLQSSPSEKENMDNRVDFSLRLTELRHSSFRGSKGHTRGLIPHSKSHNPPGVLRCAAFGQPVRTRFSLSGKPEWKKSPALDELVSSFVSFLNLSA